MATTIDSRAGCCVRSSRGLIAAAVLAWAASFSTLRAHGQPPFELTAPSQVTVSTGAIEHRPLGAPRDAESETHAKFASSDPHAGSWLRTGVSLALVLVLIAVLHQVFRHVSRRSTGLALTLGAGGRAPSGVLEVLGRYPVGRGQSLVLLRMDRRVLLLGQSQAGFTTLSEITDEDEVASLVLKTRDEEGESNAARFNDLLRRMENNPSLIAAERGEPDHPGGRHGSLMGQLKPRLTGVRA